MPDILKTLLTFLLIISLLRRKLNVGYVLMISSVVLAVLYRMDLPHMMGTVRKASLNEITVKLLLALSLIRIFELMLRENELLSSMTSAAKGFIRSRRLMIISMPVLIGMLPSLGGAYFSAPMVKDATSGFGMSREEKAFINYWFRHPWELILPLYPGILLASAVSNIPLYSLIAANFTYAVALIGLGFAYSMRKMGEKTGPRVSPEGAGEKTGGRAWRKGLSFLPVFAVLFLVVAGRMELHYALLLMIVVLFFVYRYKMVEVVRLTKYGFGLDVITLIFGVMLFKETMEVSGAVANLSRFFLEQGIPSLPIICLLPFVTGLLTGVTVAFVGTTFPLVMSITGGASITVLSLAFAAGFVGVLLSPVHLCLILTKEYFKADLWGLYRKVIPAGALIFIAALLQFVLLRYFLCYI